MISKKLLILSAIAIVFVAAAQCLRATDGTWSDAALNPGDWSVANNWVDGTISDGDSAVAYFDVDVPTGGVVAANVDAARTIGNLFFYDADASTPGSFLVQGANVLTLSNAAGAGDSFPAGTSTIYANPVVDLASNPLLAAEISATVSVADGNSLRLTGGGLLKISGNTTVVNGNTTIDTASIVNVTGNLSTNTTTALDPTRTVAPAAGITTITAGATVNLSGSGKLVCGDDAQVANAGTNGTLNVGLLPTDSATATFNSGLWVGGGTTAATGTINVRGTSTLSTAGGWNKIEIGCWGIGAGVLNVYDSAVVSTPDMRLGHNDSSNGTINTYNSGKVNVGNLYIGDNADPTVATSGGTVNMYNTSQVNVTSNAYVGAEGNGTLNINNDATMTVGGTFFTSAWGDWLQHADLSWYCAYGNKGTVTIGGSNRVALQAWAISTGDGSNWPSSGTCTGIITVTDSAQIKTTADCYIGHGSAVLGTLNLNTDAQATIGGQLYIGYTDSAQGYVNVSGNAKLTAAGIQISSYTNWASWNTRQLNISENGLVASTGSVLLEGTENSTAGSINVSGNGQLTVGGNLVVGVSGGQWNAVKNTGTKAILVAGNFTFSSGELDTAGITSNGTGIAGGVDVLGTLKLNGGWIYAASNNSDFIKPAILVQAGGAKIEPQWNSLAVTQAMAEDSTSTGGGLELGKGYLKLTGALTYTGATTIDNQWSTLEIDSPGTTNLAAISGPGTLAVGNGVVNNTVTASSINVGTLTLGAGSTLVIDAIPGGPSAGGTLRPVPEPSTLALLAIAALGLAAAAWRKNR